jgi:chlorophyll synthase
MAVPQVAVIGLLISWDRGLHAAIISVFLVVQFMLMHRLLKDPEGKAAWYNATGTTLYVLGMLAAAFAVRTLQAGA